MTRFKLETFKSKLQFWI